MRKLSHLNSQGQAQVVNYFNSQQLKGLNALLDTGLWGNSTTEVVRRIVDEKLQQMKLHNEVVKP